MSKSRLSLVYLIGSFILVSIALAYGASQVITFFQTGADTSDILILDTESVNDYYQPKIRWQPLRNSGRKMEPNTLTKLSKDYVASYFHRQQAMRINSEEELHDHFTAKSRHYLASLVSHHTQQEHMSRGTTISHEARLDFYSEDGTIATLTDQVISFQEIEFDGQRHTLYDTSSYRIMLLLEDNFWRVRHSVKGRFLQGEKPMPTRLNPDSLFIHHGGQQWKIQGINYYPQHHPWTAMWESFDTVDFSTDFRAIKKAGFNTVRIFVPFHEFGGAAVEPVQLEKLKRLLDHVHAQNLQAIVTLFDFFLGYPIEEWTLSDRHAETIVSAIRHHPALLAWDVKNEPDLDFEGTGKKAVTQWLDFIIRRVRSYDPHTPITIGWSQPEAMPTLQSEVDFLSFHYYRDPVLLGSILDQIPSSKPIFLGETGSHSFDDWWFPFKRSDAEQLEYYESIGTVIRSHDLHYAFWTWYDFQHIPSNVAGKWPWQKGPQKSYGILGHGDAPKPAFHWIKNFNKHIYGK